MLLDRACDLSTSVLLGFFFFSFQKQLPKAQTGLYALQIYERILKKGSESGFGRR